MLSFSVSKFRYNFLNSQRTQLFVRTNRLHSCAKLSKALPCLFNVKPIKNFVYSLVVYDQIYTFTQNSANGKRHYVPGSVLSPAPGALLGLNSKSPNWIHQGNKWRHFFLLTHKVQLWMSKSDSVCNAQRMRIVLSSCIMLTYRWS